MFTGVSHIGRGDSWPHMGSVEASGALESSVAVMLVDKHPDPQRLERLQILLSSL